MWRVFNTSAHIWSFPFYEQNPCKNFNDLQLVIFSTISNFCAPTKSSWTHQVTVAQSGRIVIPNCHSFHHQGAKESVAHQTMQVNYKRECVHQKNGRCTLSWFKCKVSWLRGNKRSVWHSQDGEASGINSPF